MSADKLRTSPYDVFSLLNLKDPALAPVSEAVLQDRFEEALIELHRYFVSRRTPGWSMEEGEKERITAYVEDHCGSDLEAVIKTSDEVVRQTFLFRFPWDMERTRIPVTFEGEIDWNHVPDQDVEWAYMLNRHRYWLALGQAYTITGEDKYAAAFCRQLEDWIDRNPAPEGPANGNLTWRTIEAGLRCVNWIKTLRYVKDSPLMTPLLLAKALISLHQHGEYLASSFTSWKKISNWGVLETCGLYHAAMFFPEFALAENWKRLSEQRLQETARVQVMADGVHWEQSPTYHHEVLACYLDCIHVARLNGDELAGDFKRTVYQMASASLHWAKPNHRQPMLGDSDDSDIRSLITYAAWLFQDGMLRFGGHARMDYDNAWLLGTEGIRDYDRLQAVEPAHLSCSFPHSGHFVMRSGWNLRDLYLYFHCGPLGGGHGHADLLHIDLHAYGRDLLTDLGRYNYSDHTPLRKALKESVAHNTTVVDGIGFTEINSTWDFGRIAKPSGCRWVSKPGFDYVQGGHDGYLHWEDPVYPLRRIIFIKPHFWLLVDSFTCRETHTFSQSFHFAPGEVELEAESLISRTNNGPEANLCIIPVDGEGLECSIHEGVISREYNLIEPNQHAVYSRTGKGTVSIMQVLYPQKPGETACPSVEKVPVFRHTGEQVEDAQAVACKIVMPGTGEEHTLVISHKVPSGHFDSYVVEGVQIFGEVVWIAGDRNKKEITTII